MQLIDIRIVQDTNGVPYQVADVLEDGALLPHSVNLHAFIGELLEQNHNLKAEVANLNAGAKLMHSLATGGESRLDADLAAMLQWEDEKPTREPYIDRNVTVPQTLRSYATYKNTGKAQPLSAEAVDGERLGE